MVMSPSSWKWHEFDLWRCFEYQCVKNAFRSTRLWLILKCFFPLRPGSNALLHMSRTQFNQLISCEVRRLSQLSSTDFIWSGWGVPTCFPTWLLLFWARACILYMYESSPLPYLHIPSVFHNHRRCNGYRELYSGWNIDFALKNHP